MICIGLPAGTATEIASSHVLCPGEAASLTSVEIERRPPGSVTQADRETAVETLRRAAEDGRLPLERFSERVGKALAAETRDQLQSATAGLQSAPPVGAVALFGDLCVDVPEGVEVELTGFDFLGDRELRLAAVPRRPGIPLIRMRAYGMLGDVNVRTPADGEEPPSWWAWFRRHSPLRRRTTPGGMTETGSNRVNRGSDLDERAFERRQLAILVALLNPRRTKRSGHVAATGP